MPPRIVDGTSGNDTIDNAYVDGDGDRLSNDGSVVDAGGGDDYVYGGWGNDTIDGGDGDDRLFGGDGDDSLSGGDGNDTLWGDDGNDTLLGGDGDDKLIGGAGDDLLIAGAGNDLLIGDNNPDDPSVFGNDTLVTSSGNDTAYGGGGDDVFQIFDDFGNHLIVGGETDEIVGDTLDGGAVTANLDVVFTGDETGTITRDGATINFSEIERTRLGSGDDNVRVVTSTTGVVDGGAGFDTLELPDPLPGQPGPVVTITSETDYPGIAGATTKSGYVDFPDGTRMYFDNFEKIICFTPGTLIDTLRGRVAVEALVAGDRVLTRDHGYQPLAWTGRRDLSADQIARCPSAAPIRIAAGALGKGLPERDLLVSPRHRMLIAGARAELMFGEREVLVAAADLLGLPGVTQEAAGAVSYVHVMCDTHQIIRAEGAWSESFQPAAGVLGALDAATRAELLALFPELATENGLAAFASARPVLAPADARALIAA